MRSRSASPPSSGCRRDARYRWRALPRATLHDRQVLGDVGLHGGERVFVLERQGIPSANRRRRSSSAGHADRRRAAARLPAARRQTEHSIGERRIHDGGLLGCQKCGAPLGRGFPIASPHRVAGAEVERRRGELRSIRSAAVNCVAAGLTSPLRAAPGRAETRRRVGRPRRKPDAPRLEPAAPNLRVVALSADVLYRARPRRSRRPRA